MHILQDFIPRGRKNRPGHAMQAKYITIHETGNPNIGADARGHGSYLKSDAAARVPVSYHFTVDGGTARKQPEIVQHLPLDENGWHAGDGAQGTGNRQSIGVEICVNADGIYERAVAQAAELCAWLYKQVPSLLPYPQSLKQHYDWTKKNCPRQMRAEGRWPYFIDLVGEKMKGGKEKDMLDTAIVVNTFADMPAVEPLAKRLDAPIFLREACGQLNAETVIVAGGDGKLFERPGVQVVNLSGKDRWLTASNVGEYYRSL